MQISKINNTYNIQKPISCNSKTLPFKNTYENKGNFKFSDIQSSSKPLIVLRKSIANSRQKLLELIQSEEEYNMLLDEILSYIDPYDLIFKEKCISTYGYENTAKDLQGLIAYCGTGDLSGLINQWLSGRKPEKTKLTDRQIANIIRVFEYSLNKSDKEYGIYRGIVYRTGFFNPNTDKQYYSTSFSPICAIKHSKHSIPTKENTYSIIKIKNGHRIYDFQKSVGTKTARIFANSEKEILIDRKSRFRLIPLEKYTEDDIDLKIEFIADCLGFSSKTARELVRREPDIDMYKYIFVWEEI